MVELASWLGVNFMCAGMTETIERRHMHVIIELCPGWAKGGRLGVGLLLLMIIFSIVINTNH